jgi:hypothetical protein
MKTWIWTPLAAALVLCLSLPSLAVAGGNPDAVLALHIGTRTAKNVCTSTSLPSDCGGYNTNTGSTGFFNLYLTVANYDTMGVAGLQFGIDYDANPGSGADVSGWTSCADLEFPGTEWPKSASGNLVTWEPSQSCQGDLVNFTPILAGAFEVFAYGADNFGIVPRPVDGKVKVADCFAAEDDLTGQNPSRLAVVSFGLDNGYNPCASVVPVQKTTWGAIKSLFEN